MVIAVAAELRILGRPLPFDYTLQGRGRAIRRSFGRGQGQRVSRCRPTHERPPPGRRPLTMIVGGAAADTTPPADRRRYQNPRVRLLAAFDRLDDEGRDLLTDFAGKYALVLETSGA